MSTLRVFADPERLRVRSGEGGELEIRGTEPVNASETLLGIN